MDALACKDLLSLFYFQHQMIGEHIHWYVYDGCNLDCVPCFRPHIGYRAPPKRVEEIAYLLVDNGVKKVTLTGGEPLLQMHLDEALKILKWGDVYVSLHTNGTFLTSSRIPSLSGLVDDIGVPIDSMNRALQKAIRDEFFLPFYDRLYYMAEAINENGMDIGYHTIFTMANHEEMAAIYDFINAQDFLYWRIYEFNVWLAWTSLAERNLCTNASERERYGRKFEMIRALSGIKWEDGEPNDNLLPLLRKTFEEMKVYDDPRIQFSTVEGVTEPYAFIDNTGTITSYDSLGGVKRVVFGNVLEEGFKKVMRRLENYARDSAEFRCRRANPKAQLV